MNSTTNDIVTLNVGGKRYQTALGTMIQYPDGMLAQMFSPTWFTGENLQREIFIDRDGILFRHVLNYLRDGPSYKPPQRLDLLQELRAEAEYFRMEGLLELIDKELIRINDTKPFTIGNEVKWCSMAVNPRLNCGNTVPEFDEFCWLPGGRIQKECRSCSHIAYIPWRLGQMRQMTYEPEMAMEYAQGRVVRVYGTSCAEVAWFYMDAKTGEIDPTRFYAPVHISQDLLYLVRGELHERIPVKKITPPKQCPLMVEGMGTS